MKYIISVLLAAALLLSAIPAAAVTATPDETAAANPDTLYGDTDGDGNISIQDSGKQQPRSICAALGRGRRRKADDQ